MIDIRTAPYAALVLRVTIAGLFAFALYGKFVLKPISLWWNGLLKAGYNNRLAQSDLMSSRRYLSP